MIMDLKALKFRYNIASMMVYEQVTNKPFAIDGTITSMMVLVWSVIEANNPGTIELSKMLEWFDEHPEDMTYLLDEFNKQIAISNVFAAEEKKTASVSE